MMKIATWNIPYSFRSESHSDAWEYYLEEIPADYHLGQEVRPPDWVHEESDVVWAEVGDRGDWGSAIVSRRHDLREIDVGSDLRGAMMAAESRFSSELEITLVSLYGLFEGLGDVGYATPNLHRMLSDLTGLLDGHTHGERTVIMGGDLNTSLQFDEASGGDTSRVFFQRVEAFGLTNCFEPFHDDYVQTLRHSSSDRPWQNDYLFVDDDLADGLEGCEVIENEAVRRYSDHNPVVITVDVP